MATGQKNKKQASFDDTVAASLVSGVLAGAVSLGADESVCLSSAGLSKDLLASPTARVDFSEFSALLQVIGRLMKDEASGVRLGGKLAVSSFNALGYAAASCNTLFDALHLIPKYESLVMTLGNTEIIERNERVEALWSMKGGQYMGLLEDLFLATWITLGKLLTGHDQPAMQVSFTHQSPKELSIWYDVFGSNLLFNQEVAGIRCDADVLALPILQSDPFVHSVMTKEADGLASAIKELSVAAQVTNWLIKQLPNGEPDQKLLASTLNLSERTLRRRLQQENTTYQRILDSVREERATYYLSETTLSLLDISMLLGYQQLTAFNAAYKRWTGCTPGSQRNVQSH